MSAQVAVDVKQYSQNGTVQKQLGELKFEHTFVSELPSDPERKNFVRQVHGALYSWVDPTPTSGEPYLVSYSPEVCKILDLDPEECKSPEFAAVFSGQAPLPQGKPYAQCYGGHQFGSWAGQLGDGRAISLGECINYQGQRWELQLKGAGKTPYSRFADGRAVMRSSIREFVASEALHHLGIPTTRALCCVGTGVEVMRDMFYNGDVKMEPGAVVCRVSPSFIRFGTFQLPASRSDTDRELIKQVADYAIKYHFPHLENADDKYLKFFVEIVESTARLIAKWQCVGFVHGVLNTDNMSILGLTIDYGPYGFVDKFDPLFTPNLTDFSGRRYCFRQQPEIGQVNCALLSRALVEGNLIKESDVTQAMSRYMIILEEQYTMGVAKKLGLKEYDEVLVKSLMQNMYEDDADFNNTFRALSSVTNDDSESDPIPQQLRDAIGGKLNEDRELQWTSWINQYKEQLSEQDMEEEERIAFQNSANPVYIPRQHLLQIAIEAAEKGDFSEVQNLMKVLKNPFVVQDGADKYRQPPPAEMIKPGITCLSCSS